MQTREVISQAVNLCNLVTFCKIYLKNSGSPDQQTACTVNVLKFQTLYSILFFLPKICFLMQWFLTIPSGMANSADPNQTAPSGAV